MVTTSEAGRQRAIPAFSGQAFWLLLTLVTPAAAGGAVAGLWPLWHRDAGLAAAYTVLATALLAIGIVLFAEPGQRRPALAMLAAAGLVVLSWSNEWHVGPWPLLAGLLGNLWLLACAWALYRYPDNALTVAERWVFGGLLAWLVITPVLQDVFSRPQWHDFDATAWWPAPWPNRVVFGRINDAVLVGNVVVLLAYAAMWTRKIRTARPAVHRVKLPSAIAALVAALASATVPIGATLGVGENAADVIYTVSATALLVVPAAFLFSVSRRLIERKNVADVLLSLQGTPSPDQVVASLRRALHDPDLKVAYWSASEQEYRFEELPLDDDWPAGDVLIAEVDGSAGEPLALIRVDQASARDSELVEATLAAFSLILENAILLTRSTEQLAQLRAISARIVHASDAERQRIESNLHDGAQQRFLTVGLLIGALEADTSDPAVVHALSEIREQLHLALDDLRDLSRGLHPGRIRMGLHEAVREATAGSPYPVDLDFNIGDLSESTALTAYYAICEALTNITKHAQAEHAWVSAHIRKKTLHIRIDDDGRGGAAPGDGRGLSSMTDRITAVGGSIHIESPIGRGTSVRLLLPCE